MYRRFTFCEIDRPFKIYIKDLPNKPIHSLKFSEIRFSGEFADCFGGEGKYNETHHFYLNEVVKITYTYYDWLAKKKVNQIIYKKTSRS